MKAANGNLMMGQKQMVFIIGVLCGLLLVNPQGSFAQSSDGAPTKIDSKISGASERVDLGDGSFKKVYRNGARQIVREEVFEPRGTVVRFTVLVQTTDIEAIYPNSGRAAQVSINHLNENAKSLKTEDI